MNLKCIIVKTIFFLVNLIFIIVSKLAFLNEKIYLLFGFKTNDHNHLRNRENFANANIEADATQRLTCES